MALNIGRMGRLVRPKPKFLDSWESNHLSKALLKRSLNFSIFMDTTGTLILAHCVKAMTTPILHLFHYLVHYLHEYFGWKLSWKKGMHIFIFQPSQARETRMCIFLAVLTAFLGVYNIVSPAFGSVESRWALEEESRASGSSSSVATVFSWCAPTTTTTQIHCSFTPHPCYSS